MYNLKSASQTSRADIATYDYEGAKMPSYGYWLFSDGYAIGWYERKEDALQACYDRGFDAALMRQG